VASFAPVDAPQTSRTRADLFLLATVVITLAIHFVPYGHYVGYPLLLLSTLVHELGHGLAGVLVGARFSSFEMWPNGAGVAQVVGSGGRVSRAIVSAGGLVGPAVAAAIGFVLARGPRRSRAALGVLSAALLLANLLVVRNLFGWFFVTSFAAILALVAWRARPWTSQLVLLFLSVQLSLSVFSRSDYLFTETAETGAGAMPSDVANMADALFLPYWFWGALCGGFSIVVLAVGAWLFLRRGAHGEAGAKPQAPARSKIS
jgi:hypothetical protein